MFKKTLVNKTEMMELAKKVVKTSEDTGITNGDPDRSEAVTGNGGTLQVDDVEVKIDNKRQSSIENEKTAEQKKSPSLFKKQLIKTITKSEVPEKTSDICKSEKVAVESGTPGQNKLPATEKWFMPTVAIYKEEMRAVVASRTVLLGPTTVEDMADVNIACQVYKSSTFRFFYQKTQPLGGDGVFYGYIELIFASVEEAKQCVEEVSVLRSSLLVRHTQPSMPGPLDISEDHKLEKFSQNHSLSKMHHNNGDIVGDLPTLPYGGYLPHGGSSMKIGTGSRLRRTLCVLGIDPSISKEDIHAAYPDAQDITIPWAYKTHTRKWHAYVEFASKEEFDKNSVSGTVMLKGSQYNISALMNAVAYPRLISSIEKQRKTRTLTTVELVALLRLVRHYLDCGEFCISTEERKLLEQVNSLFVTKEDQEAIIKMNVNIETHRYGTSFMPSAIIEELFHCDVCNVTLKNATNWKTHIAGRKHKNKSEHKDKAESTQKDKPVALATPKLGAVVKGNIKQTQSRKRPFGDSSSSTTSGKFHPKPVVPSKQARTLTSKPARPFQSRLAQGTQSGFGRGSQSGFGRGSQSRLAHGTQSKFARGAQSGFRQGSQPVGPLMNSGSGGFDYGRRQSSAQPLLSQFPQNTAQSFNGNVAQQQFTGMGQNRFPSNNGMNMNMNGMQGSNMNGMQGSNMQGSNMQGSNLIGQNNNFNGHHTNPIGQQNSMFSYDSNQMGQNNMYTSNHTNDFGSRGGGGGRGGMGMTGQVGGGGTRQGSGNRGGVGRGRGGVTRGGGGRGRGGGTGGQVLGRIMGLAHGSNSGNIAHF